MTGYESKKKAALDEEGMYLVHQTARDLATYGMYITSGGKRIDPMSIYKDHLPNEFTLHNTTPPQRPWVGLTDADWKEIEDMPDTFDQGVAWCLATLQRKNT